MPHRAVLLSDLHLTSNPALDDFARDDDLAALVDLPLLLPDGDPVDLVLLGDTFDLWQSVSDAECRAADARDVRLEYDAATEAQRLTDAAARHPGCIAAWRRFAGRGGARLVFVAGNHDRALVAPEVQAALAASLGLPLGAGRLVVQDVYDAPELALYAEHGSQYDRNNAVERFDELAWRSDSAGYFFVKLFFNRLERLDSSIENSPGGWAGVWHWLRRLANLPLLASAIRFFFQYAGDARVPRRLQLGPEGSAAAPAPQAHLVADGSAPLLLSATAARSAPGSRAAVPQGFFAEDPDMEQFYRTAYRDSEEVRSAVNEILDARALAERGSTARGGHGLPRPEVPLPDRGGPGPERATPRGSDHPADEAWAGRLFTGKPYFRPQLSFPAVRFVVFGHTHDALRRTLPGGALYLNSGSWTPATGPLPLIVAEASGNGPTARLVQLVGGTRLDEGPGARAAPRPARPDAALG